MKISMFELKTPSQNMPSGIALDRIQSQLLDPALYLSDRRRQLTAVIKTLKGQLSPDALNRALRLASFNCAPQCISLLLQQGADPNSTVIEMIEWDDYLNPEEPLPASPLALVIHGAYTMAAALGSAEEEEVSFMSRVRRVALEKPNPETPNTRRVSKVALEKTASESSKNGDAEAINGNGDSDADLSSRALHRALASMTILLEKGADADKAQEHGATALFMAAASRLDSSEMVELLLKHNADPTKPYLNPSNGIEMTPVDIAFKMRNVHVVTELETERNVCAASSGAETLERWSKLGDLMPADILLLPNRQGTNFPLHAALLISEKLGKLAHVVNASKQEQYRRAAKKYETIACNLYKQIYQRTPTAELRKLVFEDEVRGRTVISIASDIRSSEFMYTIREIMLGYWLGPNTTDSLIDRMLLHPLRYPLAFGLYNRCFWGTPRGRYFLEFVLYILFLGLYTMVLRVGAVSTPSVVEVVLYVFVVGFVKNEVSQLRENGFLSYVSSIWNLMDVLMYTVFLACLALRLVGVKEPEKAQMLGQYAYIMMACNSMLLWLRTLNLFTLNEYLGPLVRTIVKMLFVVVQFFVVVAVVFLGFGEGIFFLVCYFHPEEPNSFGSTLLMLYNVLLGNFDFDESEQAMPTLGPIIIGIFLVVGMILLLNLLIALMSNEFEAVKDAAVQEYFFGIAETTLSYQKSMTRMPVPICIIDIPFFFLRRRYRMTLFCALSFFTLIFPLSIILALLGGRRRRNLFLTGLKKSVWAVPKSNTSSENPLVNESALAADDTKRKGIRVNRTRELRGPMPAVNFLPETVLRAIGAAEDSVASDQSTAISIVMRSLSDRLTVSVANTTVKMDKVDSKVEHLQMAFNARDAALNARLDKLESMLSGAQQPKTNWFRSSTSSTAAPAPPVQMP